MCRFRLDPHRQSRMAHRRAIEKTGAIGTASVRARPSRLEAPWIGWNGSTRSDTGGQIRIAVPTEQSWGGSPDPRWLLRRAVGSPHSGNPLAGQGFDRAGSPEDFLSTP